MRLLTDLGEIFYLIVLPVLLLAGLGYLLQRRLGLDMPTLVRLNFFFVTPTLVYVSVVSSPLSGHDVWQIVAFSVLMLAGLAGLTYVAALIRGVPRDTRAALMMCTMFYNSGNYGLPLQDLAFRSAGPKMGEWAMAQQVFVIIVQNFTGFTLGVAMAAAGRKPSWRQNVAAMLQFPPVWALAAAILTIQVSKWMGPTAAATAGEVLRPFWQTLLYIRDAFIAIALITLGAQLGTLTPQVRSYPVKLSVLLRLVGGPLLGLAMVYLMGLRGMLAQVLLISTASPTAVNCMLLCLQFDNHPEFAARSVFYSTLLSPLTVTLVIFLSRTELLPA